MDLSGLRQGRRWLADDRLRWMRCLVSLAVRWHSCGTRRGPGLVLPQLHVKETGRQKEEAQKERQKGALDVDMLLNSQHFLEFISLIVFFVVD